jgi:hypothetical protein
MDFKHPNALPNPKEPEGNTGQNSDDDDDDEQKGCAYFFRMFDETILRPILIYKYHRYKTKAEIDFNEVV